jgi:hypothetical protein
MHDTRHIPFRQSKGYDQFSYIGVVGSSPDRTEMSKKHLRMIIGLAMGGFCAFAVDHWPMQAVPIQMALYSGFVFAPLIFGFWSNISRSRFWICILLTPALHAMALLLIRPLFPFRTVLVLIPIALIEFVVLAVVMLKILGESDVDEAPQTHRP